MKKKIAFDMALNIVATAIPTIVLQLLLLPALSRYMSDDRYGLFVTILSLLNMIPSTLGNVLNNIRLIEYREGTEGDYPPDYSVILLIMVGINLITMTILSFVYDQGVTVISLLLTLFVSVLLLVREYFIVAFRIKLNYKNIVISNLIMVVGYGLGFLLFLYCGRWQLIYIIGYGISLAFIIWKSDLWCEPLKTSNAFSFISKQAALLTIATFLGRMTSYADKLLIFPILGGATVSVYYAATLFGKVVSMAITPISSVMLTYLSKVSKKNDNKFKLAFFTSLGVCAVGYFVCVTISRPVLGLLYPQFVNQAMNYIWITTGTMALTALISIVNPFVLKFFDMRWQIVINGIYVAIYICLSMPLLKHWGLQGFCIGALAAAVLKLAFMLYVYEKQEEKNI